MVAAVSDRIPRVPPYSGTTPERIKFPVRAFHPLRTVFPVLFRFLMRFPWMALQPRTRLDAPGLGSSPFDRHYSGNRSFFLFLQVLRCFSSLRSLRLLSRFRPFRPEGFPIRTCADQFLFADPRAFSQLTTSFLASRSPGIPRSLFFTFSQMNLSCLVSP